MLLVAVDVSQHFLNVGVLFGLLSAEVLHNPQTDGVGFAVQVHGFLCNM